MLQCYRIFLTEFIDLEPVIENEISFNNLGLIGSFFNVPKHSVTSRRVGLTPAELINARIRTVVDFRLSLLIQINHPYGSTVGRLPNSVVNTGHFLLQLCASAQSTHRQ